MMGSEDAMAAIYFAEVEDDANYFFSQLSLDCTNSTEGDDQKDASFTHFVSINDGKNRRRKRCGSPDGDGDSRLLLVRPRGLGRSISMDMEEIKACRDLGLSLPREWTVEISCGTESGFVERSTVSNWSISSLGDDPREIKARLKLWAQAVALASSSSSSSLLGN